MKRIAIIGGGVSGLAAAHRLLELAGAQDRPILLHLLEAGDRLGGVIATERRDGFLLEAGPDSFITDKPWALDLCRRLGITDRLIGTNPAHRRSYVVHAGRLHPVPEGFQLLAPSRLGPFFASGLFTWPGKLRMALEPLIPPRRDKGDESLAHFVERRLGREALARIAQPMIAGIYGADPYQLSLEATLPRFRKMEQEHGSIIRAMWRGRRRAGSRTAAIENAKTRSGVHPRRGEEGREAGDSSGRTGSGGVSGARYGLFVSFDDGMQTLVDALAARLPAGCVSLGARVTGLQWEADGRWQLEVVPIDNRLYDAVCLALPAHRAAELVGAIDPELEEALRDIPYGSAATVNLVYRRQDVPHPLDGFGFVVPATEGRRILGCTFSSVKFAGRAPEGFALLRAFLGGPGLEAISSRPGAGTPPSPEGRGAGRVGLTENDAALVTAVRQDLELLLGITAEPLFATIHRSGEAMAQYRVGHLERVAAIEARVETWPGLALAGNGYRGIGIPDCVHSGERAAEALWAASELGRTG